MLFSKYSKNYENSPKFVDLFCGAGGLSLGCAQAGGIPVAALDSDEDSIDTYKKMFSVCEDVQCAKIEEWTMEAELTISVVRHTRLERQISHCLQLKSMVLNQLSPARPQRSPARPHIQTDRRKQSRRCGA